MESGNLQDFFNLMQVFGYPEWWKAIIVHLIPHFAVKLIVLLLILSPLSLYLSLKICRLKSFSYKKLVLTSFIFIVMDIISTVILCFLSTQLQWLSLENGLLVFSLFSLFFTTCILWRFYRISSWKSLGLSFSYMVLTSSLYILSVLSFSYIVCDASLDPEAQKWLTIEKAAVADQDNLYYALIGFGAELNENPYQQGLQCIQEYNDYYQKKILSKKADRIRLKKPDCLLYKTLSISKDLDNLCDPRKEECLDLYRREEAKIDTLTKEYRFLLNRYLSLYQYPRHKQTGIRSVEVPFMRVSPILKAHNLLMAQTGTALMKSQNTKAFENLTQDMAFQHLNLSHSEDLIFTVTSITLLTRDLHLYAQFLDFEATDKKLELPLLTTEEKDFTRLLQSEFQFGARTIQGLFSNLILDHPGWISEAFFQMYLKPNATNNHFLAYIKATIDWSRLPPNQIQTTPIKTPKAYSFTDVIYNPIGTLLSSNDSADGFKLYLYRIYDLDGLIRLVKIKQKVRQDKVAKDQMESFLRQDIPYFKNLYTNQPMTWDAKNETLYFNNPAKEGQKIEIKIPFPVK